MKAFYNANYHAHKEDNRLTQVWGCDIYLTHGVKAPNWADTNFTCQTAPQIACWVVCFPLCLVTAVPYLCYKKCIKYVFIIINYLLIIYFRFISNNPFYMVCLNTFKSMNCYFKDIQMEETFEIVNQSQTLA